MSEREEYPAGVPCWVDVMVPDPAAAREFYGGVFGWEFAVSDGDGYAVARLGGRDVAGVGALELPSWNTYVLVDRVEEALERATAAGGTRFPPGESGSCVIRGARRSGSGSRGSGRGRKSSTSRTRGR